MGQNPQQQYHEAVMVEEVVQVFEQIPDGVMVDATFGAGGHTRALLAARPSLEIIAIDRDPDVAHLDVPDGVTVRRRPFGELDELLDELGIDRLSGALFDLGVSGHQLDVPERGFSYREPGPLDMRMGPDAPRTADEIVNEWDEGDLATIIREYGEERFASRIARSIVASRPIRDTRQLAEVVRSAIPAATRRSGGHPARRTFQAIRIAVNDELAQLERGLDATLERLTIGGRCAVLSYHSLEDRIVKQRFAAGAQRCVCPPEVPVCVCGREPSLGHVHRKALRPTEAEKVRNPRARSARLRAVEKVAA
jgi:16S rRNA (cytosine1402-N4)-methyltransferase